MAYATPPKSVLSSFIRSNPFDAFDDFHTRWAQGGFTVAWLPDPPITASMDARCHVHFRGLPRVAIATMAQNFAVVAIRATSEPAAGGRRLLTPNGGRWSPLEGSASARAQAPITSR